MAQKVEKEVSAKVDTMKQAPSLVSRLAQKVIVSRQADKGQLLTVCAFACAAECVNTMVTPEFSFRGMDVTGTFCNLSGAFLGGLAVTWGARGPRSSALSDAFRGGFLTAYTSFCHVVDHSTALQCGRSADSASQLFLVSAIFGGPLCFDVGRRMGRLVFKPSHHTSKDEAVAVQALASARLAAFLLIVAAIATQGVAKGPEACLSLSLGVLCTAAACQAGDVIVLAATELMEGYGLHGGSVNWGTIWANAAALLMIVTCSHSAALYAAVASQLPPAGGWLLLLAAEKFRSSFCGALSAYGGFSEDTATMLVQRRADSAAASIGMNTLLLVVACALMAQADCPLGGWV
mmetsp:Transcript_103117/g.300744  ORF Transcript_103117/g.300744 Transcript_103117/m.300744 type:complete len:348 (+) Transcript_103117:83-1126(+)